MLTLGRSDASHGPAAALGETVALALRSVRHPESGLAAVLACAAHSTEARLMAVYTVGAGGRGAELLAAAGPDAPALGLPGPIDGPALRLIDPAEWQVAPISRLVRADAPEPWGRFQHITRLASPLPGGEACVVLAAHEIPVLVDVLREAASPLILLTATLAAIRGREQLRLELHRVRQERALLAAGLQHDLRGPLTSIYGGTRTLANRWDSLEARQREELVQIIAAQSDRLNRMLTETLSAEGMGSELPARRRATNLEDLAQRAADAARFGRGGEIAVDVRDLTVTTDPDRLERALLNLLDNALKYAPKGSVVHVLGERAGAAVNISVADEGPGVAPELVPSLFTAYATDPGRRDGIGLGLHSVAQLVADLGGRVGYRRQEGWTRFTITLPEQPGEGV